MRIRRSRKPGYKIDLSGLLVRRREQDLGPFQLSDGSFPGLFDISQGLCSQNSSLIISTCSTTTGARFCVLRPFANWVLDRCTGSPASSPSLSSSFPPVPWPLGRLVSSSSYYAQPTHIRTIQDSLSIRFKIHMFYLTEHHTPFPKHFWFTVVIYAVSGEQYFVLI